MLSNIEPLARAVAERVCRQGEAKNPSNPPMTAKDIAAWVDTHWECAAAELEAGVLTDEGNPVPGSNWELGLAAYRERVSSRQQ